MTRPDGAGTAGPVRRPLAAVALGLALVVALPGMVGCTASSAAPVAGGALPGERARPVLPTTPVPDVDTRDLREAMLSTMPACGAAPADPGLPPVAGLLLPVGSVVTSVTPGEPPLVQLEAYVPLDPVALLEFFADRGDLLVREDEVVESETLTATGTHRQYVKATAVCATASTVVAVVAPELSAAGLPVPTRSPFPTAP